MKTEQIIMLVIAFLLGYHFNEFCGKKNIVEGVGLVDVLHFIADFSGGSREQPA